MGLKRVHGRAASGGFSAAKYWDAGADTEPQGSTTMSRIAVFSPVRLLSAVSQFIFLKSTNAGGVGWALRWWNNQQYHFRIDDSGGTLRSANFEPTVMPQKGDCIVWCGSYDEAELIVYANGESNITGPWVGFLPTAQDMSMGAGNAGGSPASDFNVLAVLATDTHALSLAECAAAEAAIKVMLEQGQDISKNLDKLPGTGWSWVWDARHIDHAKGEWVDDVSGVVLSEVGRTQDHYVIPRMP